MTYVSRAIHSNTGGGQVLLLAADEKSLFHSNTSPILDSNALESILNNVKQKSNYSWH